jgi:hypothetical protein
VIPVPESYTCVDCGGVAHLITLLPADAALEPGYPLAYRCADCMERFDIIWEPEDFAD